MALRIGNKLGIEFHQSEIRVFESKAKGNEHTYECVGSVPMDAGYLQYGILQNPESAGERLRIFLDRQRITATDVVASFPSDNCMARVLTLPQAPESEMASLINGEVEHYGLVRQGGVYDHTRLSAPIKEGGGSSVLLMATESTVISAIDKAFEKAGLRLVALEPTHIALFRAAHALAVRTDQAIFVTISEYRSDVSLMNDGKIAFYRSFEVGTNDMMANVQPESEFPIAEGVVAEPSRHLNLEAAASLAIEVRRSIDYFSREMPDLPRLSRIIISANCPTIEPIAAWLQESTGLEAEFIRIHRGVIESSAEFSHEDGVRYLTCYGLAVRDSQALSKDLPRLDLSLHEQMVSALEQSDRKARIAAYLCCGVLIGSIFAASLGTMKLRRATEQHVIAERDLALIQDLEKQRIADIQKRTDRLALLQKQGIAVNPIVLGIGRSVPTEAGLSDIRLSSGKVDLSGEARAEEVLVRFTRSLQTNPFVSNVSLSSFERLFDQVGSRGIRFRMTVGTTTSGIPVASDAQSSEVAN